MTKQKFDLSNPGGQPKDWMQKEHEKEVEANGWDNIWVPIALIGLPLLLIAGGALVVFGFFK